MISGKKYKLIVVDDHPFLRDGVKRFINSNENFEIIGEFSETRPLLNSYLQDKPDVIILDLNLPGLDGEKSCGLLKRKYPDCKILAFTQYQGREKDLLHLGFDGYVLKSETDILFEALVSILNGGKYFKETGDIKIELSAFYEERDMFLKAKKLTPREIEVAKLMALDYSNREIGNEMCVSESTIETHRKHIKEKLQVKTKRELNLILRSYLG